MRRILFTTIAIPALLVAGCSQGETESAPETAASAPAEPAAAEPAAETPAASEIQEDLPVEGGDPVDLAAAPAGTYVTDAGHRYITFTYDHQGYSKPFVRWRDWSGTLEWNPENPAASSVSVTIDANSIDTGVDAFDEHMRTADLFETAAYPQITFVSTGVERTGANTGRITGDLTIKGVTKPVTLDAVINKAAFEQRGNVHKIGFSATTTLNRSDYNVGYAVPFVGDAVDIIIEAEFQQAAPAAAE